MKSDNTCKRRKPGNKINFFLNTKNNFYLKSTLVETLLTFCPPGPLLQE